MRAVFTGSHWGKGVVLYLIIIYALMGGMAALFVLARGDGATSTALASENHPVLLASAHIGASTAQSKLRLAALPAVPFAMDPLLGVVLSRDTQDETADSAPTVEEVPPADVAAITRTYMQEKIDTLMEVSGRYEIAPELLQREQEQAAVEALVLDAGTGLPRTPPVVLFPGVHIFSLAPLEATPLTRSTLKSDQVVLKSGEGEEEGEAAPFETLDIESDFITFLSSFFEDYTAGMEVTFDFNAFTVETIDDIEEILPAPNGIPDLAELLVLETFLKTPTLDFSLTGGPSHQQAVNRWQFFETLYGPVSDPSLAPIYRVGVAYSCLDDFMSIYVGAALLAMATGNDLDLADLIAAMETTAYQFCQSGDIDGDQYSALIEWQQYGTGQTFAEACASYEAAVLNPAVYPSSVTLHTVMRTCDTNVILFYPPQEKVADGVILTQYASFGYDAALFAHDPYFDHWVITGESPVSPRYSGADKIEVLVEDDITIDHAILASDLSASVSFPDAALEAAIRTAIGKPTGTLVLGDVYTPAFTELHAADTGIVSLDGLQHCRFLKSLWLGRNSIATLTPLSTLYRLNGLDLGCNQITDISALANLHDLTDLEMGIMFLNYLFHPSLVNTNRPANLAPLMSLLYLEYLGLTDTGLQGTALAPLAASGSALETLPVLSIGKNPGLDLTPLADLDGLLMVIDHDSNLTDTVLTGLSGSTSLMAVYLFNNNLESLAALSGCTDMLEVNVYNNPNFAVVPNTFPDMNVFTADQCALSNITNLGGLSLVSQLSLSDNAINDITPLLTITAFEEGAVIDLIDTPLAHAQSCAVIAALRGYGVEVRENASQCWVTLTYQAGLHGHISGSSPQTVYFGESGASVEAVPDWGYYFLNWSDDRTDNPRADTNVTGDITVTAAFAPYQYALSYLAENHGSIDGPTPQLVDHAEDGLPVTAVPDYGYHFTDWDDGRMDNPRIDTANTEPLTVYAAFDINQYYLNYLAEPNGTILGNAEQLVTHGDCGSAVEAFPDTGYHFSHWSDGLAMALRADCGNTEPLTVTAGFQGNPYTVSFDAQGGSTPSPTTKTVTFRDIYGTLPATVLPGHFFEGWWTVSEGGQRVLSATRVLTPANHTLYAQWTAQTSNVFFHGMGASTVDPPFKQVTFDQPYGTLATAVRPGYSFDGWWTAAVGGVEITPETTVTDTRINFYLYAHWTQITSTLTYLAVTYGSIAGEATQTVPWNTCGVPVTAVPDTGYHFELWSDLLPDNPRMDCYNTEPLTVTAGFAINQYTLVYAPGDYGTLSGNSAQVVHHGADGTAVEAIPDAGRTFVLWSDGVTANPRTDTAVTGDINVTAVISAPAQYTLNYVAGPYGTITGPAIQAVGYGEDGAPVTAVPDAGCYFIKWSDERADNPRTDTDVTGHVSVTAIFAINQYTLHYAADTNGCLWGPTSQTVNYGGNGAYIAALPDEGYHFASWSDAWVNPGGNHLNAIRKDMNVTANIDVTASFVPNVYMLSYAAGENGSLLGQTPQHVYHGQDGAAVQAEPDTGYHFVNWSDGSTDNPRMDRNVQSSLTVTANFAYIFGDDFSLPACLQSWMDFLSDGTAENPLNTLAWFRDTPDSMYNYMLSLDWGSSYNWAALWTYATWHELNAPMVIDSVGLLNLNFETDHKAISDIVEFIVVEMILKDSTHPLHTSVMNAYLTNLGKWLDYNNTVSSMAPGFVPPSDSVLYALAAYSTINDTTAGLSANFFAIHVSRLNSSIVPKPPTDFSIIPELDQDADLDGDGFTNLEEFCYVDYVLDFPLGNLYNKHTNGQSAVETLEEYADYIMNKELRPILDPEGEEENTWTPCECPQQEYTIYTEVFMTGVGPSDKGMIVINPQKEKYSLGEKVEITYIPTSDTVFDRWEISPPSHTAHLSTNISAFIYVVGATSIKAYIIRKTEYYLNIYAPNTNGVVVYDPGPHNYDSIVPVIAIPQIGYVPVWSRLSYEEWESASLYNQGSADVFVRNSGGLYVRFEPELPYGEPIMRTGTVQVNGGEAQVFTSGSYCRYYDQVFTGCHATGPYISDSAETRDYFSAECIPDPEFFVSYWHYDINGLNMYFGKQEIESVYLPDNTLFTVNLVPGISLNLHVEGQGVITSDNFQKLYNPKSYNADFDEPCPFLFERSGSNSVEMQHHACPGYAFSHWEIKDAQGNWTEAKDTQGNLITGDLSVWMNWFQPGSLFHVPDGQLQYDVKAVFEEICFAKLAVRVHIVEGNPDCYIWPWHVNHGHAWIEIEGNSVIPCGLEGSIGFWPSPTDLDLDDDSSMGFDTVARYYEITLSSYKKLENYINNYFGVNCPEWSEWFNCAGFAAEAVKEATGEWLTPYMLGVGFCAPAQLCSSIKVFEQFYPTSKYFPKKYCPGENEPIIIASGNESQDTYGLIKDHVSPENYLSRFVPSASAMGNACCSIHNAIIQNNTVFAQEYLSTGGNIDATDWYGKTLLHHSIETGQIDMIDFLLAKGANPYGLFCSTTTGLGYEDTPLFTAYQLQNDCEFAAPLCTAIVTVIAGAAATVDTNSTSIVNCMANDNVSGILNVLASGTAIRREVMEQLNWYALGNCDLTLFTAAIQHPSFSLAFTAEEFFNDLLQNKTQYQDWINLMRNYFNRSFYVCIKYSCIDWEYVEDDLLNSMLILACGQGNLDLVNFLLPLGADPTVQVNEDETLLEHMGDNWSQLEFAFPYVLPDWPTANDDEILQALQEYTSLP